MNQRKLKKRQEINNKKIERKTTCKNEK